LSDCKPLSFLTNLKYLDLSSNNITNIEPIRNMKSLIKLDINCCFLFDDKGNIIETLSNLENFWVNKTSFKIKKDSFKQHNKLRMLRIDDMPLPKGYDYSIFDRLNILIYNHFFDYKNLYTKHFPNLKFLFCN